MKIIGVVHLMALPGSPLYANNLKQIYEAALKDAQTLKNGGVDSIIIENFGDTPFVKDSISKLTLSHFVNIVSEVTRNIDTTVGINVLRNDGEAALSIADATGSAFVRINILSGTMYTDQGIIEGKANKILKLKHSLENEIEIYSDVFVKHAVPPPGYTIENQTEELLYRAGADKIIITGDGTGKEIDYYELKKLRKIVPEGKLAIGSGVNEMNIIKYQGVSDILIIGTGFKVNKDVSKAVDQRSVEKIIKMIK
jgi:membrane complex biogenesis BtpA family protein